MLAPQVRVVVWLMMHILSANVPCSSVDDMNAGSSQNMRASTVLLTLSSASSSISSPARLTRKHTIPSVTTFMGSRTGLARTYSSARAESSIPSAIARRNAAIPKVWTDIQTFNARAERLSCRPRLEKLGWFAPQTVSWRMSGLTAKASVSVLSSFTRRQPAS